MLSDKRKQELKNAVIEGKETEEYLVAQEQALGRGSIDQSWHILLTYLSTEDLAKHSKTLSIWTKIIGVSTILLFISAVLQLVKLFFFSQ